MNTLIYYLNSGLPHYHPRTAINYLPVLDVFAGRSRGRYTYSHWKRWNRKSGTHQPNSQVTLIRYVKCGMGVP